MPALLPQSAVVFPKVFQKRIGSFHSQYLRQDRDNLQSRNRYLKRLRGLDAPDRGEPSDRRMPPLHPLHGIGND